MKRIFEAIAYVLIFLGIQAIAGAIVTVTFTIMKGSVQTQLPAEGTIATMLLFDLVALALFILLRWFVPTTAYLRSRPWDVVFWCVVAALGALAPSLFLQEHLQPVWPQWIQQIIDQASEELALIMTTPGGYFIIALMAPVVEEMVFRGTVLRTLLGRPAASPADDSASVGAGPVPARWPDRASGSDDSASVGAGPVPARWPDRASDSDSPASVGAGPVPARWPDRASDSDNPAPSSTAAPSSAVPSQPSFSPRRSTSWRVWALVISALLFALSHLNPAQMPHAFLIGLLLGWLYMRTGSILPGIIYHWANNTAAYLLFHLYPDPDATLSDILGGAMTNQLLAVLFSLCLLLPAIYQLNRRMKPAM